MAKPLLHRASQYRLSALATKRTTWPTSPPSWHPLPSTLLWAANMSLNVTPNGRRVGFLSLWPNYRSRIVHSHSRKLLAIMQQRRWDAVVEHDLAHAGITVRPNIVDQVIACIPSSKLALQFFIWAGEQIGYPALTSRATQDIVQWYSHKSRLFPFLMVLKGLEDQHFVFSPSRVNVLLQGYGWAGMLDRAFKLMLRTRGFSNDMLVKCFFHSIMSHYRYDMVYDVYMEMKKEGTRLDVCYNELIQGMALADGERWHEADLLFKQMADAGHVMAEKTCNALIMAVSRAGQHERAHALLEDIIRKKIRVGNVTVVAVIESLCHAKELHRASRVIEEMKHHGFVVESKVYNSFLEALGGEADAER